MKGEIIDMSKCIDAGFNEKWQIVLEFEEIPPFIMGNVEVTQK